MNFIPRTIGLRTKTLAIVLWVFGLSTTLFLIGVWGRAVVVDEETVSQSVRTALESESVADRVYSWLADGLESAAGLAPSDVEAAIAEVRELPQADTVVTDLIDQIVGAVMAPPGSEPVIDIADTLRPVVPAFAAGLQAQGIAVEDGAVDAALDRLDPVELETEEFVGLAAVAEEAEAALTTIVAITVSVLLVTGAVAIALSQDRVTMLRTLLTRVAVSGLSYAVIFRVGGWILSPNGGRSPLLGSGAVVLRSNLHVFIVAALGAASLAAMTWVLSRRRGTTCPAKARKPRGDEEPTRELVGV
jgi:hypothetical protein